MLHNELIEKVREGIAGRDEVILQLYKDTKLRRALLGTLIKKGCTREAAEDHFMDAVLIFVKSCLKPNFEITSSLQNYLIGISKHLWYKEVTKSSKERPLDDKQFEADTVTPLTQLIHEERQDPLRKLLNLLDAKCKQVLLLWAHKRSMIQIAEEMNYKSDGMARKKKHHCARKMYALINDNPGLKDRLRDML